MTSHTMSRFLIYVTLEPRGLDAQVVRSDLASYLGSKLKPKQEEGLNNEVRCLLRLYLNKK